MNSPTGRRTDRASAEIQATAGRLEALARFFPGDELEPIRSWLLAVGGSVAGLVESLPRSAPGEQLRLIGEHTREGIRRMDHNRGRQR